LTVGASQSTFRYELAFELQLWTKVAIAVYPRYGSKRMYILVLVQKEDKEMRQLSLPNVLNILYYINLGWYRGNL